MHHVYITIITHTCADHKAERGRCQVRKQRLILGARHRHCARKEQGSGWDTRVTSCTTATSSLRVIRVCGHASPHWSNCLPLTAFTCTHTATRCWYSSRNASTQELPQSLCHVRDNVLERIEFGVNPCVGCICMSTCSLQNKTCLLTRGRCACALMLCTTDL
jgi:hypothetical protein